MANSNEQATPKGISVNQSRFADWWGVNSSTVKRWIAQGMPAVRAARTSTISIDSAAASNWLVDQARDAGDGRTPLGDARIQKETALARKAELEVARLTGDLVEVGEVRANLGAAFTIIRQEILGMGDRLAEDLAGQSDPVKIRATIMREARRTLNASAEQLAAFGVGDVAADRRSGRRRATAAR